MGHLDEVKSPCLSLLSNLLQVVCQGKLVAAATI